MTMVEYLAKNPQPNKKRYESNLRAWCINDFISIEDIESRPQQDYLFCKICENTVAHFIDGKMHREWQFIFDKDTKDIFCVDCSERTAHG